MKKFFIFLIFISFSSFAGMEERIAAIKDFQLTKDLAGLLDQYPNNEILKKKIIEENNEQLMSLLESKISDAEIIIEKEKEKENRRKQDVIDKAKCEEVISQFKKSKEHLNDEQRLALQESMAPLNRALNNCDKSLAIYLINRVTPGGLVSQEDINKALAELQ